MHTKTITLESPWYIVQGTVEKNTHYRKSRRTFENPYASFFRGISPEGKLLLRTIAHYVLSIFVTVHSDSTVYRVHMVRPSQSDRQSYITDR